MPRTPLTEAQIIDLRKNGVFLGVGMLMEQLSSMTQDENASDIRAVVVFFEAKAKEPELYVRSSDTPKIVDAYDDEPGITLKKSEYVACVRFLKAGIDPSWMIVNNKKVHIP